MPRALARGRVTSLASDASPHVLRSALRTFRPLTLFLSLSLPPVLISLFLSPSSDLSVSSNARLIRHRSSTMNTVRYESAIKG